MTKLLWVVCMVSAALLGLTAIAASLWLISGGRVLAVATGSMQPYIAPGDAVLVRHIPTSTVRPGTIVSYRSSHDSRVLITHRVAAVHANGMLTTQGDALTYPDPTVHPRQLTGRVYAVAPKLGTVLTWFHNPYALGLFIYIPVALVAVFELQRLQKIWQRPTYMHPYARKRYGA